MVQPVLADLPVARLLTIFPPGAGIGTTVEVSLSGVDLDDPDQILFSITNIAAVSKPGDPGKFVVTVASNAAPGICDVRCLGRFGISNPRAFVIGDLPELIEKDGNRTMAAAMEIPLGATVNGHADASGTDFFKFSAKHGQRILVECAAKALDSRMDAGLVLCASSGRELERNRKGGLIDFTAKVDGQYFIKVHDLLFRGGTDYFYRLSISAGPHIDFIFPPAGLPGTKSKYMVYGRNLRAAGLSDTAHGTPLTMDGKALEQLEVEIELPAGSMGCDRQLALWNCVVDGYAYRLQTPQGVSNPILLSFATGPVVAEKEPNDKAGQIVSPPCEVVGQFYPAGDRDRFTFAAKKGEVYWAEVFSHRLGMATGPFLLGQRVTSHGSEEKTADLSEVYGSDSNIGGTEFKTSTLDPVWRFEAPENGTYRVEVRDLFNQTQSDPSHLYRLSLRRETPDFQLIAFWPAPNPGKKDAREAHVWSGFLRRGETIPLKVMAFRRDNFKSEIDITIEGLPPGVSYSHTRIEAEKNSAIVLLTAANPPSEGLSVLPLATNLPVNWGGTLRILGKASTARTPPASQGVNPQLVREAHGGTVVWDVTDYNTESVPSRLTHEVVLGLSGQEAAPISIAAEEESDRLPKGGHGKVWEVKAGSKAHIPLRVIRRGDFTEGLKLKAVGIPALDSLKEIEVDGKATNGTVELDLAQLKIPSGPCAFYLQTQTKGRYRNNPEAAQAAESAAKEAAKAATDMAAAARQASKTLGAANKKALDAEAMAKLVLDKLSKAKNAAEEEPDNQELSAASVVAEKQTVEAVGQASAASQAKAAAERASAEASVKAKEAEATKTALANRAKELAEKAKPKEITLTVYSAPIRLKIIPEEKK